MEKDKLQQIEELLTRGVSEVIDREHLKKRLLAKEQLRVKFGIDPTSPNIHIGRAVALLKLKDLQDLGHQIVFLIGDFTGVIGDTSDKESERPMLEKQKVEENLKTYVEQAGKILEMSKVEVVRNSEWLGKLGYGEIGEHADQFSLAEFIARENIKKRLESGTRISLREVLYPLMQGYDSVELKADLELGGTDQRFNLLAGRELQKHFQQEPQDILMTNLIEGTDGRKMSSSWGNTVNLTDAPNDMFGKIMSVPDELIGKYLVHCTRVPMAEIEKMEKEMEAGELNPRDAKLRLAGEIVKIYHGEDAARDARDYFIKTISEKQVPDDVQIVYSPAPEISLVDYMLEAKLADSKSAARRKIEQGGVSVDGEKVTSVDFMLGSESHYGAIIKVGKRNFKKIAFK